MGRKISVPLYVIALAILATFTVAATSGKWTCRQDAVFEYAVEMWGVLDGRDGTSGSNIVIGAGNATDPNGIGGSLEIRSGNGGATGSDGDIWIYTENTVGGGSITVEVSEAGASQGDMVFKNYANAGDGSGHFYFIHEGSNVIDMYCSGVSMEERHIDFKADIDLGTTHTISNGTFSGTHTGNGTGLTNIADTVSRHIVTPTNGAIFWFENCQDSFELVRTVTLAESGTVYGCIVETGTNGPWNTWTTNMAGVKADNDGEVNSTWNDSSVALYSWLGFKITNVSAAGQMVVTVHRVLR